MTHQPRPPLGDAMRVLAIACAAVAWYLTSIVAAYQLGRADCWLDHPITQGDSSNVSGIRVVPTYRPSGPVRP